MLDIIILVICYFFEQSIAAGFPVTGIFYLNYYIVYHSNSFLLAVKFSVSGPIFYIILIILLTVMFPTS